MKNAFLTTFVLLFLASFSNAFTAGASDIKEISFEVWCQNHALQKMTDAVRIQRENGETFALMPKLNKNLEFKLDGRYLILAKTNSSEKVIIAELSHETSESNICDSGDPKGVLVSVKSIPPREGFQLQYNKNKAASCYKVTSRNPDYPLPIKETHWVKDITSEYIFKDDATALSAEFKWSEGFNTKRECEKY